MLRKVELRCEREATIPRDFDVFALNYKPLQASSRGAGTCGGAGGAGRGGEGGEEERRGEMKMQSTPRGTTPIRGGLVNASVAFFREREQLSLGADDESLREA